MKYNIAINSDCKRLITLFAGRLFQAFSIYIASEKVAHIVLRTWDANTLVIWGLYDLTEIGLPFKR